MRATARYALKNPELCFAHETTANFTARSIGMVRNRPSVDVSPPTWNR